MYCGVAIIEFKSNGKTVLYVPAASCALSVFDQQGANFSRFVLIGTAGYYLILAYMLRCVRKYFLRHSSREKQGPKSLVLMTTRDHAKNVLKRIQNKNVGEFTVTGIIYLDCEPKKDARIGGVPVVAGMSGAVSIFARDWVDEVFFAIPQMDDKYRDILYAIADMSIVVHICVGSQYDFPMQKRIVEKFGEIYCGDYDTIDIKSSGSVCQTSHGYCWWFCRLSFNRNFYGYFGTIYMD